MASVSRTIEVATDRGRLLAAYWRATVTWSDWAPTGRPLPRLKEASRTDETASPTELLGSTLAGPRRSGLAVRASVAL